MASLLEPGAQQPLAGDRAALDAVAAALPGWTRSLLDMSGRNELLYCKDRGKLRLAEAQAEALDRLLAGRPVRLSDLFDGDALPAAENVAAAMRRNIRNAKDELGIGIGRVASGMVGWASLDPADSKRPAAPLLLRQLTISQPQRGRSDFLLTLEPEVELNEVLLHLLERDFQCRIPEEARLAIRTAAEAGFYPAEEALQVFRQRTAEVPGLSVLPGLVGGAFRYQKLPMVEDLQQNAELFARSDLVAAMAGDPAAIATVREQHGRVGYDDPDRTPPEDEFLVLDADPSQNYAINAALAGRNLIIQGPPGTGKSQTIANLIAASVARGKSVLFVAEKRAAVDAVVSRLEGRGLQDLVIDLHGGIGSKTELMAGIRAAIQNAHDRAGRAGHRQRPDPAANRERLLAHTRALHQVRQPWGMSVFEAQTICLGVPEPLQIDYRLPWRTLNALDVQLSERVRQQLGEAIRLGALHPESRRSPWASAAGLRPTDIGPAFDAATAAHLRALPALQAYAESAAATGLRGPRTAAEWSQRIDLLERARRVLADWEGGAAESDLDRLLRECSPGRVRRRNGWRTTWGSRRRARLEALAMRRTPIARSELAGRLSELIDVRDEWRAAAADRGAALARPEPALLVQRHTEFTAALQDLERYLGRAGLDGLPIEELQDLLAAAAADAGEVAKTSRINELRQELGAVGLDDLLARTRDVVAGLPLEEAASAGIGVFDYVRARGALDHIALTDPVVGAFDGTQHSAVARAFAEEDREHRDSTPQRILRTHAGRLADLRRQHPEQDAALERELLRKRRIKPVRELNDLAPDLLTSAKPCWVMSPLTVSQVLPATAVFDVVVFDEASQIRPADAIPALGRARKAVVCGDSRQMPPTSAFQQDAQWEDPDEEDLPDPDAAPVDAEALTDADSLLETFEAALGGTLAYEYRLNWHYRSRDARLIAFSNALYYDGSLLTFPGTRQRPPLDLVLVPHPEDAPQDVSREVAAVVELAVEHARQRPSQSLGIIAMGIGHSRRIEQALEARLKTEDDDVREFFSENAESPAFVKNLERVQGDERDAIIISLGYVKGANGRLAARFGSLSLKGGERRLNVAVTRAREQLTVVSSFTHDDLDTSQSANDGPKHLRRFLQFMASGGRDLGDIAGTGRPLNPFEEHVRDRLLAAGIPVHPQYGVAGYWLDFAAAHPSQPGRMVLAIEADGAAYHSSQTARARDRLRQEHLERLGWTFHRIWSRDYFSNPDREVQQVLHAYQRAVADADRGDQPGQPGPSASGLPTIPGAALTPAAGPDPDNVRGAKPAAPGSSRRPPLPVSPGKPISSYKLNDLKAVVAWVASDGKARNDDQLLAEAMQALGFKRRGSTIVDRLTRAIQLHRE